jgi:hypothetical protein
VQQRIDQRGLAMIDVGDNGHVSTQRIRDGGWILGGDG